MADELQEGEARVLCGVHSGKFSVVGRTADDVRCNLRDLFNINDNCQVRANGAHVPNDYVIMNGDTIEFIRPQGQKAAMPPPHDPSKDPYLLHTVILGHLDRQLEPIRNALAKQVLASTSPPKQEKEKEQEMRLYINLPKVFLTLAVLGGLSLAGAGLTKAWKQAEYDANFKKYVDASIVAYEDGNYARARKYREYAMKWLEDRGMNKGRTDVFINGGPEADIDDWMHDFHKALVKAEYVSHGDHEKRAEVKLPPPPGGLFSHISLAPYNKEFGSWAIISIATLLGGLFMALLTRK